MKIYFAYGSNLHQERHKHYGANPRRGWLADLELAFERDSTKWGGGALNLVPRPGQLTPGVLFEVDELGWAFLDKEEGAPRNYVRFDAVAFTEECEKLHVTTYRLLEEKRVPDIFPAPEYLDFVRAGYAEWGLNPDMLDAAARKQPCPNSISSFFVYGTLMRGECRWNVWKRFNVQSVIPAECAGYLRDIGAYPGMLPGASSHAVAGEFITVRDMDGAVRALDRIEGFRGFDRENSLFRRAIINVQVDGAVRRAWTYLWAGDPSAGEPISGGDWRRHNNSPPPPRSTR